MKKIAEEKFDQLQNYVLNDTEWLTRGNIEQMQRAFDDLRRVMEKIYDSCPVRKNG